MAPSMRGAEHLWQGNRVRFLSLPKTPMLYLASEEVGKWASSPFKVDRSLPAERDGNGRFDEFL